MFASSSNTGLGIDPSDLSCFLPACTHRSRWCTPLGEVSVVAMQCRAPLRCRNFSRGHRTCGRPKWLRTHSRRSDSAVGGPVHVYSQPHSSGLPPPHSSHLTALSPPSHTTCHTTCHTVCHQFARAVEAAPAAARTISDVIFNNNISR